MRSNSVGRTSRIPLPTGDAKKIQKPIEQQSPFNHEQSATTSRSSSTQKLRPSGQFVPLKSANQLTEQKPMSRSTTPTSTLRSSSSQRSRPTIQQVFVRVSNTVSSPVPIDQRSKFNLSKSQTPTKPELNNASTPTRAKTPTRTSTSGSQLKALVGPYSFFLKELKKERSVYTKDDSKERDLRTIMNQVILFRLQLSKKLEEGRNHEEKLLLTAWQLVYEAEEEAFGLKSKERIALEINKIHAQLIDMDGRIDQVNNFLAPVFEKLSTYVNLRMAQNEEAKQASSIRFITAKATANREYSVGLLNLEKSVRILERMVEKRDRMMTSSIKSEVQRIDSFHAESEASNSNASTPKHGMSANGNANSFASGSRNVKEQQVSALSPSLAKKPSSEALNRKSGAELFVKKANTESLVRRTDSLRVEVSSDSATPKKSLTSGSSSDNLKRNASFKSATTASPRPGLPLSNSFMNPTKSSDSRAVPHTPTGTQSAPNNSKHVIKRVNSQQSSGTAAAHQQHTPQYAPLDLPGVRMVEHDGSVSDDEDDVPVVKAVLPPSGLVRTLSAASVSTKTIKVSSSMSPVNAESDGLVRAKSFSSSTLSRPSSTNNLASLAQKGPLSRPASGSLSDFESKLAQLENLGFGAGFQITPITTPTARSAPTSRRPSGNGLTPTLSSANLTPLGNGEGVAASERASERAIESVDSEECLVTLQMPDSVNTISRSKSAGGVADINRPSAQVPPQSTATTSPIIAEKQHTVVDETLSIEPKEVAVAVDGQSAVTSGVSAAKSAYGEFLAKRRLAASAAVSESSPSVDVVIVEDSSEQVVHATEVSTADPSLEPIAPMAPVEPIASLEEKSVGDDADSSATATPPTTRSTHTDFLANKTAAQAESSVANSASSTVVATAASDDLTAVTEKDVSAGSCAEPVNAVEPAMTASLHVEQLNGHSVNKGEPVSQPAGVPAVSTGRAAFREFLAKKSSVKTPVADSTFSCTEATYLPEESTQSEPAAAEVVVTPAAVEAPPAKLSYKEFLAKKSSVKTPVADSTFSYTEATYLPEESTQSEPAAAEVVVTPAAVEAPPAKLSYKEFLARKASASATPTGQSSSAFSYTEESYTSSSVPQEIAHISEKSEELPEPSSRPVSTRSAYSDFFSKKASAKAPTASYTVEGYVPPVADEGDECGSAATGDVASSIASPDHNKHGSNSSSIQSSRSVSPAARTESSAVSTASAPMESSSGKSAYKDFLSRRGSGTKAAMVESSGFSYTVDTYTPPVSTEPEPSPTLSVAALKEAFSHVTPPSPNKGSSSRNSIRSFSADVSRMNSSDENEVAPAGSLKHELLTGIALRDDAQQEKQEKEQSKEQNKEQDVSVGATALSDNTPVITINDPELHEEKSTEVDSAAVTEHSEADDAALEAVGVPGNETIETISAESVVLSSSGMPVKQPVQQDPVSSPSMSRPVAKQPASHALSLEDKIAMALSHSYDSSADNHNRGEVPQLQPEGCVDEDFDEQEQKLTLETDGIASVDVDFSQADGTPQKSPATPATDLVTPTKSQSEGSGVIGLPPVQPRSSITSESAQDVSSSKKVKDVASFGRFLSRKLSSSVMSPSGSSKKERTGSIDNSSVSESLDGSITLLRDDTSSNGDAAEGSPAADSAQKKKRSSGFGLIRKSIFGKKDK